MPKVGLHQLAQSGATDGQAVLWSDAAGEYVPGTPSGGGGGGGGGTGKDRRWNVGSSETTIDEFDDSSLDAAWVRVDGTGAASGNMTVTEDADVLSIVNLGNDTADVLHGVMRPLSSAGGALSVGDGFVTCLNHLATRVSGISLGGLILSDSAAIGSGKQVAGTRTTNAGTNSGTPDVGTTAFTNWNTAGTSSTTLVSPATFVYIRLALISANTWRVDASPDGIGWIKGATVSQTMTPTYVGFASSSWGNTAKHVDSYEFLRRVSGIT